MRRAAEPGAVSVTTTCDICGHARAQYQCERCASFVCADHYDATLGFCTDCAAQVHR